MKGTADEPQYAVGLLEGGVTLCDVIDNYINEQTLVGVIQHIVFHRIWCSCGGVLQCYYRHLFSLLSLRRMPSLWQTWEL